MARRSRFPTEASVVRHLSESRRGSLKAKELAKALKLPTKDFREFRTFLFDLVDRGRLYRVKGQRFAAPEKIDLVVGRLSVTSKGDGFVKPDAGAQEVFVPGLSLDSAMDGDQVVTRIEGRPRGRSPVGRVLKVLERAHETLVGTYRSARSFGVVHPQSRKIDREILVIRGEENGAGDGDVVVVRITAFGSGKMNPSGTIEAILGKAGDPGVDILAVIHGHRLPTAFPDEVERHAEDAVARRRADPGEGRIDRTELHAFTIDPADAKDHDDALSVRRLENGELEVGVHIADVSHFVDPGDPVDLEALKRATSVYLVDRVIPMLPHVLSTDACSLLPGVDRYAMSVFATMDATGLAKETRLERTHIRSRHKLSYEDAQAVLDRERSFDTPTDQALADLSRLARVLRSRRQERGALDFDLPEARVVLGDGGQPLEIQRRERLDSHRLVEDFMLLANEIVARISEDAGLPVLYRVHEAPPKDKMLELQGFLTRLGLRTTKGVVGPKELQVILAKVEGTPEGRLVSTVVLRSMSRARYAPGNLGHFGLAATHYTHFTSPIRRYPDLWLHRVLAHVLIQGRTAPDSWGGEALDLKADRCSTQERVAEAAERESVDLKKAEYMERHLGDEFTGTIAGVTSFGLFVLLDEVFVEGLVHVNSMMDDYYTFHQDSYRLVGERSRRSFRLGDRVAVRVSRVDKLERLIDFVLLDSGRICR